MSALNSGGQNADADLPPETPAQPEVPLLRSNEIAPNPANPAEPANLHEWPNFPLPPLKSVLAPLPGLPQCSVVVSRYDKSPFAYYLSVFGPQPADHRKPSLFGVICCTGTQEGGRQVLRRRWVKISSTEGVNWCEEAAPGAEKVAGSGFVLLDAPLTLPVPDGAATPDAYRWEGSALRDAPEQPQTAIRSRPPAATAYGVGDGFVASAATPIGPGVPISSTPNHSPQAMAPHPLLDPRPPPAPEPKPQPMAFISPYHDGSYLLQRPDPAPPGPGTYAPYAPPMMPPQQQLVPNATPWSSGYGSHYSPVYHSAHPSLQGAPTQWQYQQPGYTIHPPNPSMMAATPGQHSVFSALHPQNQHPADYAPARQEVNPVGRTTNRELTPASVMETVRYQDARSKNEAHKACERRKEQARERNARGAPGEAETQAELLDRELLVADGMAERLGRIYAELRGLPGASIPADLAEGVAELTFLSQLLTAPAEAVPSLIRQRITDVLLAYVPALRDKTGDWCAHAASGPAEMLAWRQTLRLLPPEGFPIDRLEVMTRKQFHLNLQSDLQPFFSESGRVQLLCPQTPGPVVDALHKAFTAKDTTSARQAQPTQTITALTPNRRPINEIPATAAPSAPLARAASAAPAARSA